MFETNFSEHNKIWGREVDGLDIGGQHGRRFVLLRHTHRPQRRPCPICTNRSGNFRHRCGGGL